jgi:hypothetical protein
MFVAKHRNLFKTNTDFYSVSTRHKNDFHLPSAQLKVFQKGVLFSGIKAYNHLPINIKELSYDMKCFKPALKKFFQVNSLEEYFNSNFQL